MRIHDSIHRRMTTSRDVSGGSLIDSHPGRPSRRRNAGFTLLEIVFVLAMLAGVLGLIYLIFHGQTSTSNRVESHQEALRASLFALEHIGRELKQLVTVEVERKTNGVFNRRYGDHVTPVKISPMGRQISFYVSGGDPVSVSRPDINALTVTYSLWPAARPGTYGVRRTVSGGETADRSVGSSPVDESQFLSKPPRGDSKDRLLPGVLVRDLRYRLLEPAHPEPGRRSPDDGFYVETVVVGVDLRDRQSRPLPALFRLDYPSRQKDMRCLSPSLSYVPSAPLTTGAEEFTVTPAEVNLVSKLKGLTRLFGAGKMGPADFERSVREALSEVAGNTTTALIGGTGVRIPNFSELSVRPHEPGEPIVLSDPTGQLVGVLSNPGQLTSLLSGLIDQTKKGAGQSSGSASSASAAAKDPSRAWWVDLSTTPVAGSQSSLSAGLGIGETFGPLEGSGEAQGQGSGALP